MYRHFGQAIIRTPLFTYEDLLPPDEDTFYLTSLLDSKLNDPVFLEALYWASPDIYRLAIDLKNGVIKAGKKKERLIHTLKKYIIRAGSRCTPYGLFAGCTVINVGVPPASDKDSVYRKIRVDTALLNNIIEHIKANPEIWPLLKYSANSSLYVIHGNYRYMEYQLKDGARDYQLNAVIQSLELDNIVEQIRYKPLNVKELSYLINDESDEHEKLIFLEELIKMQFLVTNLELEVTGGDQLLRLKNQLIEIRDNCLAAQKYLSLIAQIESVSSHFELSAIGMIPLLEIDNLHKQLDLLGIPVHKGILFHTDLYGGNENNISISDGMVESLLKATKVISMFSPGKSANEDQLKRFKNTFIEKYDTQEIPLAEVSDMEAGIGFPVTENIGNVCYNQITDQLTKSMSSDSVRRKYRWHSMLHEKVMQVDMGEKKSVVLNDLELQHFDDKTDLLANTVSIIFSVLPDGQLILHSAGGATANNLLARFAYLDNKIDELVKRIAEKDEKLSGDAILAEIAHLPEGRVGNIIRRPAIGNYEIPFLAETRLDSQIRVDDLMVSIRDNQIILRSKKLNRRIIPRLSCAHNFTSSQLPVYQLLAALQYQGQPSLDINMGLWAAERKFIPRMTYDKVILKLATWCFNPSDYTFVLDALQPERTLSQFLKKWNLPRFIALNEGDNELVFDTLNADYLNLLLEELRKKKPVKFIEWLHFENGLFKTTKSYVNQFILPLYCTDQKTENLKEAALNDAAVKIIPRTFAPGSEWIYLKIYCSAYLSDELLSETLCKLNTSLARQQLVDQFFFIRYTDPHYHIRYRMHLKNPSAANWGVAMQEINHSLQQALDSRAIWKIQFDTYTREIERYGNNNMLITEELFFKDSILYMNLITDKSFIADDNLRLLTAIKNIDKWLILFKLDLQEKIAFCTQMATVMLKEFGEENKAKIDLQYREMKNEVTEFMSTSNFEALFKIRNQLIFGDLPRENLSSYIHMSMNRWFKSEQRLMEFICYTFCSKYYQTQLHYQPSL